MCVCVYISADRTGMQNEFFSWEFFGAGWFLPVRSFNYGAQTRVRHGGLKKCYVDFVVNCFYYYYLFYMVLDFFFQTFFFLSRDKNIKRE